MKNKGWKTKLFTVMVILAGIILFVLCDLFIIGEPIDNIQMSCVASVNGETLELRVDALESAVALRGWRFKERDGTMSISARKVLVSPLFRDGSYETSVDLKGIDRVVLGGQEIWKRE
ncbi:hypothetical protein GPL15_07200 [Clostridium sp. MCC353]|uniref:hypothetical protein n=1 Tax=Clostridium sp. MCC353 TaxID=2592646 RepID=UPI001C02DA6E|nr:hypothetical protein [Clostridium sp. MCC353]MBT9776285.1 hypothetical protein [Clostridium sp. MCC353]